MEKLDSSMQAVWLEDQQIALRKIPVPSLSDHEALVQVLCAGICATDLELIKGYYPYQGVIGHEFVGKVVAASDSSWIGRRVVGEINASCDRCEQCRNGRPTHCEYRTVLGIVNRDGAFAEYLSLPIENLHVVPDSVSDEQAVFTEPLAAALEIQQQVHIQPTDRVLLVGAGRLGQLIARTLALLSCDLQVIARHSGQQRRLSQLGIQVISSEDVQPGKWDVAIEATGSPTGFGLARQAVRPRGHLVLKSTYRGELNVNFSSIVVDEITIVGSRCGPFAPALRLLELRQVDPTDMVDASFPLVDIQQALSLAAQPGTMKILLKP